MPTEDAGVAPVEQINAADTADYKPRTVNRAKLERGYVVVRVTKKGHKKIHAGGTVRSLSEDHIKFDTDDAAEIFPTFNYKDEVALPARIAKAQEDNGYAEIQD